MDNGEGKGVNMQWWRLTAESRIKEKNQLQPILEEGKTSQRRKETTSFVALSDPQMLQEDIS